MLAELFLSVADAMILYTTDKLNPAEVWLCLYPYSVLACLLRNNKISMSDITNE
jgi:hypothetical protein